MKFTKVIKKKGHKPKGNSLTRFSKPIVKVPNIKQVLGNHSC